MQKLIYSLTILLTLALFSSYYEDEGKLPNISFKTSDSYVSSDATLAGGTEFTIGINASKSEDKDVLKKFDISKSVNGGTSTSVFNTSLSGSEGNNYSYDFKETLGTTKGEKDTYTFTVTNRDGLTNQVSLTITVE